MISSLKLPMTFDVQALKTDLHNFGLDDWTPHFNTSGQCVLIYRRDIAEVENAI